MLWCEFPQIVKVLVEVLLSPGRVGHKVLFPAYKYNRLLPDTEENNLLFGINGGENDILVK